MTASYHRGHQMFFDESKDAWRYSDDNTLVAEHHKSRPCGKCGEFPTKEGHDPCLGTLPDVMNACCGHGDKAQAYIQFSDGSIISGHDAAKSMPCWCNG